MTREPFSREKLKSLIHYVIWKAGGRAGFGATKLYKIAWFADARMFMLTGASITGAQYVRKQHGPIPLKGKAIRDELAREGKIEQWQDREYDYPSWRFRAKSRPDMAAFSEDEIQNIDWWIAHIDRDHTAATISEESHDYAWQIAAMDEPLPFHALLASRLKEELTEEETERLRAKARELSLP